MRRLGLTLLAFIFVASACFGTTGSWQCANGASCVSTPGGGFRCPGVPSSPSASSSTMRMSGRSCSHCRTKATGVKLTAASGPGASICRGCECRFKVTSLRVPATTMQAHNPPSFQTADHPFLLPSLEAPTVWIAAGSTLFSTGPPASPPSALRLTLSTRAPPRLLSA